MQLPTSIVTKEDVQVTPFPCLILYSVLATGMPSLSSGLPIWGADSPVGNGEGALGCINARIRWQLCPSYVVPDYALLVMS